MDKVDTILKMYDAGDSVRNIHKSIKMSRENISKILKKNGRIVSFGVNQNEVIDRFNSGESVEEIASHFKISVKRVIRILNIGKIFFIKKRIFTDSEKIDIMKRYMDGESIKNLSEKFSCGVKLIQNYLKESLKDVESLATLSHLKVRVPILSDDQILELYKSGKTLKELSNICQTTPKFIKKILSKFEIEIRHKNTKYSVDDTYLDEIDTHEKAYFLGFFYGDGYHNSKKNELVIAIQSKDRIILDYYMNELQITRPLRIVPSKIEGWQEKTILSFCSKQISERLLEFGCKSNKTKELNFPTFISDEFIPSFILGMFDADGSICNKNGTRFQFTICGTFEICNGILEFLKMKGIKTSLYQHKCGIFYVKTSNLKSIRNIHNLMYEHCKIWLPRKKNILDLLPDES